VATDITNQQPAAGVGLVAAARQRLTEELAALPPWDTPALWARLRSRDPALGVSLGALVHCIRWASRAGDERAVREIFVLLLERTEAANRSWAARTVGRTPRLRGAAAASIREELRAELTVQLWQRIALGASEQWELFFVRALEFTQRHVATAFMEQRGYWPPAKTHRPSRAAARLITNLSRYEQEEDGSATPLEIADSHDGFSAADLADLRDLVLQLPSPQRQCVVMRYWQDASEQEIAHALGDVSTRTVRNYLRRAYQRLRDEYEKREEEAHD
jgi:RNA polymerase sigma factor (sigma-70 family)